MSDNSINSTTQEFLDVYDITNDMVILKDGVVSIIMQIGTMNFSLLAEQEQDAIMYTYGALLNSLNFPIQINIQSNVKDASRYLRLLDNQIKESKSRAKSQLIAEYREFVANLIYERNVLEKKFFVVVPTNAAEMGLYTAESVLPGKTKFDINNHEKTVLIEKASAILDPRRDHLIAQFNRVGLFARQLDTQEIIQNFYINYNPESTEGQEVANSDSYTTPIVRASLAEEQDPKRIRQNFRQTLYTESGSLRDDDVATTTAASDQDEVKASLPERKREEVEAPAPKPKQEEVAPTNRPTNLTIPPRQASYSSNFREEIPSLQTQIDQQNPVIQEAEQTLASQKHVPGHREEANSQTLINKKANNSPAPIEL
ncbi:MAG: hypothetical protein GX559_01055 [Candidatus Pacebacteria bacterium]|nr:hypothetical protein [Candidatus Paceibacterota bacterium]